MNARERACLSHWFPRLRDTGVPVPETRIVRTDLPLDDLICGEGATSAYPQEWHTFLALLRRGAAEVGDFPVFLRTGHGSGKHDWRRTCFVERPERIGRHVGALVEWSLMVDLMGLPTRVWAVREMLPLVSTFTAFNGFPVNRERRYFIAGGKVVCRHPYWPPDAVEEGVPDATDWRSFLDALNAEPADEIARLTAQSERVAAAFPPDEAWSLDWALGTNNVWYAIDMAPAEVSFHWPDCPHARTP